MTFAPGQTSATIPITVRADEVAEPDEHFLVRFTDSTNAAIRGWLDSGFVIVDDDD